MATVEEGIKAPIQPEADIPPLVAGDKLTREEFMRRWEEMPELKFAELIGGIVYMPSPLSTNHGDRDLDMGLWLGTYMVATPGCRAGSNATTYMLEDAAQPDIHLRILPEYRGQTSIVRRVDRHGQESHYLRGAPELITETCLSSTSYDLHQKLDLYQAAGVQEYLAVLMRDREVRWHRLRNGVYELLPQSPEGIVRSEVFPGLWLNVPALLAGDMAAVLATLQQGLNSPEHQTFVAQLSQRRVQAGNP